MSMADFGPESDPGESFTTDPGERGLPPRMILHEVLAAAQRRLHGEGCKRVGIDGQDEISLHQANSVSVKEKPTLLRIATADTIAIRFINDTRIVGPSADEPLFFVLAFMKLYSDGSPHLLDGDTEFLDATDSWHRSGVQDVNEYCLYAAAEMPPLLVSVLVEDRVVEDLVADLVTRDEVFENYALDALNENRDPLPPEFAASLLTELQKRGLVHYLTDEESQGLIEVLSTLEIDIVDFARTRKQISEDLAEEDL